MQNDANEFLEEAFDETGHEACLSFSVPLTGLGHDLASDREPPMLLSYVRRVSREGMELLVPSLPFVYRYLLTQDFTLRFELNLPCGAIKVEGVPTYDRPLDEGIDDIGYIVTGDQIEIEAIPRQYVRHEKDDTELTRLVGLRIKKMSEGDRRLYDEYVESMETEFPLHVGQIIILPDEEPQPPAVLQRPAIANQHLRLVGSKVA